MNYKTNFRKLLCLFVVTFFVSGPMYSAVIFLEDFDGPEDTLNSAPQRTGGSTYSSSERITVENSTTGGSALFATQHGYFNDTSGSGDANLANGTTSSGLAFTDSYTLSFDFMEPDESLSGSNEIRLQLGWTAFNGNEATWIATFRNGVLQMEQNSASAIGSSVAYAEDTLHTVRFLVNEAGTSESYDGGSVAAGAMDVYLNGSLVLDDLAFSTAGPSTDTWGWDTDNGGRQQFYIDNYSIDDTLVIPEPSSILLVVAGLLGFTLFRKRG